MQVAGPTREGEILGALRSVIDPDFGEDIVTCGFVKDLAIGTDGKVAFTLELTTPACPVKDMFLRQSEAACKVREREARDTESNVSCQGALRGHDPAVPCVSVASATGLESTFARTRSHTRRLSSPARCMQQLPCWPGAARSEPPSLPSPLQTLPWVTDVSITLTSQPAKPLMPESGRPGGLAKVKGGHMLRICCACSACPWVVPMPMPGGTAHSPQRPSWSAGARLQGRPKACSLPAAREPRCILS